MNSNFINLHKLQIASQHLLDIEKNMICTAIEKLEKDIEIRKLYNMPNSGIFLDETIGAISLIKQIIKNKPLTKGENR